MSNWMEMQASIVKAKVQQMTMREQAKMMMQLKTNLMMKGKVKVRRIQRKLMEMKTYTEMKMTKSQ